MSSGSHREKPQAGDGNKEQLALKDCHNLKDKHDPNKGFWSMQPTNQSCKQTWYMAPSS